MSVSVSDALTGIKFIHDAVSKVKDNREELLRLAARLEHIVLALEDSKQRDLIQPQEYIDALTAISNLIERSQRILQRLLKRSLGDRTWNRDEIASEIIRISHDVQNYLSVHTIRTLDTMQAANSQQFTMITNSVEEIMVKLAEIDIRLRTPTGAPWSKGINSEVMQVTQMVPQQASDPQNTPIGSDFNVELLQNLAAAGRTTVKVTGLRSRRSARPDQDVIIPNVKVNARFRDILQEIKAKGYVVPQDFDEGDPSITVTKSVCEFDATAPGGLQISRSTPLIHWWNKYAAYHGLLPASTPSHTVASVDDNGKTITTSGVSFRFYRTLRVPDSERANKLPPNLGQFPLLPVSRFSRKLPESVRSKGGFIMPMFQREALWISFTLNPGNERAAVKVSVGGVNAISGAAKDIPAPPDIDQDYIVAGIQPWLDGVLTDSNIVRQFVAMPLGQGYTVEEQITGKAEHSGLQFDVFPMRHKPEGSFIVSGSFRTAVHMTPEELSVSEGTRILFSPYTRGILGKREDKWTLSDYRRRVNPLGEIKAYYSQDDSYEFTTESLSDGPTSRGIPQSLGLGAGGKIEQKIYRDTHSPRMYDEENGHRFHVHILSTETWEAVTGVLPPITPITPSIYKKFDIAWFSLYDEHIPGLTAASSPLGQIQSVTQLDEARYSSSSDLVDPDDAHCSKHARASATCVFRPCSHLACATCLGETLMKLSKCAKCGAPVTKFVGMKNPVPHVTAVDDTEEDGTAWNISGIEDLAIEGADSKNITIIHLPEDRVSSLYSKPEETADGSIRRPL